MRENTALWRLARAWVGLSCLGLLSVACGPKVPENPSASARRFAEAASSSDARRVHAFLSRQGQAEFSEADVARLLKENRAEFSELAHDIERHPECRRAEGRLTLRTHRLALELEQVGDEYRIASGFGTSRSGESPEAVLEALRKSLESLDLPALLELLTDEKRESLGRRLQNLAQELGQAKEIRVEPTISGYVVTLGDRTRLFLVLTPEGYRILEIQ